MLNNKKREDKYLSFFIMVKKYYILVRGPKKGEFGLNAFLEDKRIESIKMMQDEGYARSTFLSCIFMEIQRIIKEIDSKFIFNKNQRNNVDVSTFLYMNDIYLQYMQKELTTNLDFLSSTNLENFVKPIVTLNDSNASQYPPIEFDEYTRDETPSG